MFFLYSGDQEMKITRTSLGGESPAWGEKLGARAERRGEI
jgi:hypothetical protein